MKINDVFYTIQGEGLNAGRAALFIRMPFCNLNCSWCDTDFSTHEDWSRDRLNDFIRDQPPVFLAVITGGEPSMNKDVPAIIEILKDNGFDIAMESNGQFEAPEGVDHLTISPKRWNAKIGTPQMWDPYWFNRQNKPSEIKLVVDHPDVLKIADKLETDWLNKKFEFNNQEQPLFYLSPEWNQKDEMLPLIIDYVKNHPQWRINLQTHKFLGVK